MKLTTFTDYGLRMLMRMASQADRVFTTAELAEEFQLSRNHLNKITQCLVRAGVLQTRRGNGGGAALARPAGEIRLGWLIRILEDGQPLVECFSEHGNRCTVADVCRLKVRLRMAEAAFLAEMDKSTLADIALPQMIAA